MNVRRLPLLALLLFPFALAAQEPCPHHEGKPLSLHAARLAVEGNSELTVVALGSSSTQGWRAKDAAHTYPAQLQDVLGAALPSAHVAIINRGIGGQDAAEMVPRLERDVIDVHPALVIWQVGANGAMRRANPEEFERLVANGVQRLQRAKIDVILMSNQRAPSILSSPEHQRIEEGLATVARQTGAGLFDRGALMDEWQAEGHPYAEFMSDDGVHHNDLGYRCVAGALAQDILGGLEQSRTLLVHSASARH